MQRVPEPELMNDDEQALAYAHADFAAPHDRFVELFREAFGTSNSTDASPSRVVDLGCGAADVTVRFARAFTQCIIDAIDGAPAMLRHAETALLREGLTQRITLHCKHLPDTTLEPRVYDTVISNSLLHHLTDPMTLWTSIIHAAAPAARVFVMDLLRPASLSEVERLVELYASDEPQVLRHDFHHSLLAAYGTDELRDQLNAAGLEHLTVETVSDRHLIVRGRLD